MSQSRENQNPSLHRILTIARLTIHSAFRYRLVALIVTLLAGVLLGMPYLIKHNGTAEMLTQIVISYSLSLIILLLGLLTVWLSCSTLAKDIQECQMQMIAVKPISRWQIFLGKWLGITTLNACLLLVAGGIVLGILSTESKKLNEEQRDLLHQKILVARGGLKESPPDLSPDVERLFQERINRPGVAEMDHEYIREKVEEEVWALHQIVKPNHLRSWEIDFGWRHRLVKDRPLHLRVKFYAAQNSVSGQYPTLWIVGDPNVGMFWREELNLSPVSYHEIPIPAGLIGTDGILRIQCRNYTESSLIFPVEEDLEVLYPEGSFWLNFARALLLVLIWLGLLSALGLAAASILSFPVASFFVFALITIVFSGNLFHSIVEEGTISPIDEHTGEPTWTKLDWILVPAFATTLELIESVREISPIEALASGRSIPSDKLAWVFLKLGFLVGLPVTGIGIYLFHRNELATSGKNG